MVVGIDRWYKGFRCLTAQNWEYKVIRCRHPVLVAFVQNQCHESKLLARIYFNTRSLLRGTVDQYYFNADTDGPWPSMKQDNFRDIEQTPVIKLYVPRKHEPFSEKDVITYDWKSKRKVGNSKYVDFGKLHVDLFQFTKEFLHDYTEIVRGEEHLQLLQETAQRQGMPLVLFFPHKARTYALTKYLSTEYRDRLIYAQVFPSEPNRSIAERFSVNVDDPIQLPAMRLFPYPCNNNNDDRTTTTTTITSSSIPPLTYDFDGFKYIKVRMRQYLDKHALPRLPTKILEPLDDMEGDEFTGQ